MCGPSTQYQAPVTEKGKLSAKDDIDHSVVTDIPNYDDFDMKDQAVLLEAFDLNMTHAVIDTRYPAVYAVGPCTNLKIDEVNGYPEALLMIRDIPGFPR